MYRNEEEILRSIEANFKDGELLYWHAPTGMRIKRKIVLINMLELHDPRKNGDLTYHIGMHSKIQENIRRAPNIMQVLSPLSEINFTGEEAHLIVPI